MLIMTLFATLIGAVVALLFSGRKSPAQRQQKALTTTTGGKSEANDLRRGNAQQCKESIPSLCHVRPEITRTNNEAP
jgi:hypothetical protein